MKPGSHAGAGLKIPPFQCGHAGFAGPTPGLQAATSSLRHGIHITQDQEGPHLVDFYNMQGPWSLQDVLQQVMQSLTIQSCCLQHFEWGPASEPSASCCHLHNQPGMPSLLTRLERHLKSTPLFAFWGIKGGLQTIKEIKKVLACTLTLATAPNCHLCCLAFLAASCRLSGPRWESSLSLDGLSVLSLSDWHSH